jgi:23S rRNA (guanosine2251-2'-O)-methyltransferase
VEHRRIGKRGSRPRRQLDLDDVIYGVHAVEEALAGGETLRHIHVGEERRRDPAVRRILEQARERDVRVRFENRGYFNEFPYKAHQSVVAFGQPFEYVTLEDVIYQRRGTAAALYVVLDHLTDPHNAGAIIRTAEAAGADAVILPERRSVGVNATVRKAAAGATTHLPVARVANIADALRKLKKANVWIAGADTGPDALDYTKADLARDLAIVVGAEEGLSPVARKECDYLVRIPLLGKTESLNASVATAILLYEAVRQRRSSDA